MYISLCDGQLKSYCLTKEYTPLKPCIVSLIHCNLFSNFHVPGIMGEKDK